MKKKILPLFIIGILVLTSIGAVATQQEENFDNKTLTNSGPDLKIEYLDVAFNWQEQRWRVSPNIKNVGDTIIQDIQVESKLFRFSFIKIDEMNMQMYPHLAPGEGGGVFTVKCPVIPGLLRLYINMNTPGDIDTSNNIVNGFYFIGFRSIFPSWPRHGLDLTH